MHVQLRHDVAERGDVELVRPQQRFERTADEVDFSEQRALIAFIEVDQIARARDARHEDQPRKPRIVHQAQLRELQIADRVRIGGEARIEHEAHAHAPPRWRAKNASVRSSASFALGAS